ncbi:MAG: hypothetical protein FWF08_06160 [Oscillospiraceae bacterium]|nr:hypothetical protein [Oscillospiraceae bacterium]
MKKANSLNQKTYLLKITEKTELGKGVMLVASGYIFCYMFMVPEGMTILDRGSTTSRIYFDHPILYWVWVILACTAFFFNLDQMRRRYGMRQPSLAVFQYAAIVGLFTSVAVPTSLAEEPETMSEYLHFWIHMGATMVCIFGGLFCVLFLFIYKMKEDKRFKKWFFGYLVFIISMLAVCAVFGLNGLMETILVLGMMGVVYVLNHTNALPPEPGA